MRLTSSVYQVGDMSQSSPSSSSQPHNEIIAITPLSLPFIHRFIHLSTSSHPIFSLPVQLNSTQFNPSQPNLSNLSISLRISLVTLHCSSLYFLQVSLYRRIVVSVIVSLTRVLPEMKKSCNEAEMKAIMKRYNEAST